VLAANLSDLAAMGAEPRTALLSLILPDALPVADLDGLLDAFLALAARTGTHLVGGNVTRSPGPLVIDVTVSGTAKRRKVLTRAGGRAGDELWVSGTVGGAAAGLAWLQRGGSAADADPAVADAVARFLRPEPRLRLGLPERRVGRRGPPARRRQRNGGEARGGGATGAPGRADRRG
jgi:thiamine-monophosphate kinase